MQWRNRLARLGVAAVVGVALARAAAAGEVRLPDTGQTSSYINTFGEDHDYRRPRSYTVNETNGTVIDNVTGLMWQRQDDDGIRPWAAAWNYCADLTLAKFTDWRLPTIQELQALVDYGRFISPAIDTTAFPTTKASDYWSSTSFAGYSYYAWLVDDGYVDSYSKGDSYYVRCVRSGPVSWPLGHLVGIKGAITDGAGLPLAEVTVATTTGATWSDDLGHYALTLAPGMSPWTSARMGIR